MVAQLQSDVQELTKDLVFAFGEGDRFSVIFAGVPYQRREGFDGDLVEGPLFAQLEEFAISIWEQIESDHPVGELRFPLPAPERLNVR